MVQIDNVFLNYFHTSQAVGAYDAAFVLAMPPLTLIESFRFMLLPIFSDLYQDTELTHLTRIYQLATKWMVLAVLPVYLIVITFPDVILELVYGSDYTVASTALIIVFTGVFVPILLGLSQQAHIAFGKTRTIMVGNVAAAINLVANLILVPVLEIEGAALASALALGSLFIYWMHALYAETGIQPISQGMAYPVAVSSVVFVGIFFITSGLTGSLQMWATIIMYGLIHFLILATCAIEDEDRDLIRRYSNQLSRYLPI